MNNQPTATTPAYQLVDPARRTGTPPATAEGGSVELKRAPPSVGFVYELSDEQLTGAAASLLRQLISSPPRPNIQAGIPAGGRAMLAFELMKEYTDAKAESADTPVLTTAKAEVYARIIMSATPLPARVPPPQQWAKDPFIRSLKLCLIESLPKWQGLHEAETKAQSESETQANTFMVQRNKSRPIALISGDDPSGYYVRTGKPSAYDVFMSDVTGHRFQAIPGRPTENPASSPTARFVSGAAGARAGGGYMERDLVCTTQPGDPLHMQFRKYEGTPAIGAADKLYQLAAAKLATGLVTLDQVVDEFAQDDTLTRIIFGAANASAGQRLSRNEAGNLIPDSSPASNPASAMTLIAIAADMLSGEYEDWAPAARDHAVPGTLALCRTGDVDGWQETPDGDKLVIILANDIKPSSSYKRAEALLKKPRSLCVEKLIGAPNGIPIGWGELCNADVAGAVNGPLYSVADKKFKTTKWFIERKSGSWPYSNAARRILIRFAIERYGEGLAQSSHEHNVRGAAVHNFVRQTNAVARAVEGVGHFGSHDSEVA